VLGYTLFRNVWPLPTGMAWWGPALATAWLVAGIAAVIARPTATRGAAEQLTRCDGLASAAVSAGGRQS